MKKLLYVVGGLALCIAWMGVFMATVQFFLGF